jgi:hypothetical protein
VGQRLTVEDQARRIVELWCERPKAQRTEEHVLTFFGWLSEHEPSLIPDRQEGHGSYYRLRAMLERHITPSE